MKNNNSLLRNFLIVSVVVFCFVFTSSSAFAQNDDKMTKDKMEMKDKSLYQRLGGYDALAAVTDDFVGRLVTDKNQEMIECYQKLLSKEKEEFYPYLFRSKYTFSIVTPQNHKTIADAIYNANQNIAWYKENKLNNVAAQISEYGFSYCQFSYSLPKPLSQLYHLLMRVNYGDYFKELGFKTEYYNTKTKEYNKEAIVEKIKNICNSWKEKYPGLDYKTDKLKFDSNVSFNQSFTTEIEYLNLESK